MVVRVLQGDCRDVLKSLPEASVQCCVTSPPYYGLRTYLPDGHDDKHKELGLECTPDAYVAEMVAVFREVRRVLREDGTCWVNLGDSYNGYMANQRGTGLETNRQAARKYIEPGAGLRTSTAKNKDLIGIPWMVAFALRADGWYLRADNVWGKPNGMPESVTDRTTRAHEYVFLLSKSEKYYYDHEAVRTAPKPSTQTQLAKPYFGQSTKDHTAAGVQDASDIKRRITDKQRGHSRRHAGFNDRWDAMEREQQIAEGGNLRSVWWISPAQYSEAHFAVMPDQVAEICIRAGCPVGGTVLDPFAGVFTTCLVADRLGRNGIGIELNQSNCDMARSRLVKDAGMFADIAAQ